LSHLTQQARYGPSHAVQETAAARCGTTREAAKPVQNVRPPKRSASAEHPLRWVPLLQRNRQRDGYDGGSSARTAQRGVFHFTTAASCRIQHENHRLLLMELQAYRLYWTLAWIRGGIRVGSGCATSWIAFLCRRPCWGTTGRIYFHT